jgi:hypothetical protein
MDGQGERDEASWAVDGYLPMANAMATLRGFPIVLVATNHEDASLPNVDAGGSVAEVRECQRHGRADRQFGRTVCVRDFRRNRSVLRTQARNSDWATTQNAIWCRQWVSGNDAE